MKILHVGGRPPGAGRVGDERQGGGEIFPPRPPEGLGAEILAEVVIGPPLDVADAGGAEGVNPGDVDVGEFLKTIRAEGRQRPAQAVPCQCVAPNVNGSNVSPSPDPLPLNRVKRWVSRD